MTTMNCLSSTPNPTPQQADKLTTFLQPSTFHPFPNLPNLPTELRLKIWSFCHHSTLPKKLRFSYGRGVKPARALEGCFFSHRHSVPRNHIPTLLHTCHESRNSALGEYSVGFEVPQSREMVAKGVCKAFEECGYQGAMGREGRGVFWNKEKDVMWIDGYWLDDNLKAFLWRGRYDVRFPGVRWLVFDESTTVGFVQERAISWVGVETVFVVREPLGQVDKHGAPVERLAWEQMFEKGQKKEKGSRMEEGRMPELQIVTSWEEILEHLHRREVW